MNSIWVLRSHLGMYDEFVKNKEGIQTNAEPYELQGMDNFNPLSAAFHILWLFSLIGL